MDDEFVPCDAKDCRHRSYVFALLTTGHELSYCGHHGPLYWDQLNRIGLVEDHRHKILTKRAPVEA